MTRLVNNGSTCKGDAMTIQQAPGALSAFGATAGPPGGGSPSALGAQADEEPHRPDFPPATTALAGPARPQALSKETSVGRAQPTRQQGGGRLPRAPGSTPSPLPVSPLSLADLSLLPRDASMPYDIGRVDPGGADRYRARTYRAAAWRAILARMARRYCMGTKAARRLYADNQNATPDNGRHLAGLTAKAA